MIRPVHTLVGLAIALGCAMPAMAQEQVKVRVGYGDLNLANSQGAAALVRRVDNAITQICGQADGRDLSRNAAIHNCRSEVSRSAYDQANRAISQAQAQARPIALASR